MKKVSTSALVAMALIALVSLVMSSAYPPTVVYAQGPGDGDDDNGDNGNGNNGNNRVTICHVAGNADDPANYVTITISENGLNGHFADADNPREGHENDTFGPCPNDATAQVTCEPFFPGTNGFPLPNEEPCLPDPASTDRVTICHAAGPSDDPANFETITISVNGLNGHFNEDGSPLEGHTSDTMGPCPGDAGLDDSTSGTVLDSNFVPLQIGEPLCIDLLAYHTDRTGDWEIFRLGTLPEASNAGGTDNLSQGVGFADVGPSFSPDKQWVVFSSNRDGNWELYLGRTDGTLVARLTNSPSTEVDPVWSPTGPYIVYQSTRSGTRDLYLLNVTTGEDVRLTADNANNANPSWSPDASKIIFQSDREGMWQIYQIDIATGDTVRLTDGAASYVDPIYSADASQIAFRMMTGPAMGSIMIASADGTNMLQISDINSNADNAVWSPDGTMVAYESNLDGDRDVFVYNITTGITRLITDNSVDDYAPTWYCVGTTLVFTSQVSGNADLYLVDALPIDGPAIVIETSAGQLTTDPASDQYPLASPNDENSSRPEERDLLQ